MADPQAGTPQAKGALVSFGAHIKIEAGRRMPQFDNGQAMAFHAYDDRDRGKRFIAIVSGMETLPRWTAVDAYNSLADTSFMRLVGSGIVRWPMDGKQKYVFMYQGGLGECLVKEGGFSTTHWRHPDIINLFIQPMARMLKEMGDKGFAHGAIRPSNIFHASVDKNKPILLGDCLGAHNHSTQSALFLPVDKGLAEPIARGTGGIADDIYAFGVSLALFLRKNDETSELDDEKLTRKKIEIGSYATIIGTERFQASFLELLRGVLHDEVETRWNVEDIFSWLDGARLTPPALSPRKKANRPLSFSGKKYLFPDTLALEIHKNPNEVAVLAESGSLAQWLEKSFNDTSIYDAYDQALDRVAALGAVSENQDFLVTQVRMAMNPSLPIYYKERTFTYDGIGGLMFLTAIQDKGLGLFKEILMLNIPDQAMVTKSLGQNEMIMLLKQLDSCRSSIRMKKLGYDIERCIYMLCKDAPCLSPKFKDYFVNGLTSALNTYESLCKKGGQIALFLDHHAIAFFSVANNSLMEKAVFDLCSPKKNRQIAGNLRFMAAMQKRSSGVLSPNIASVFIESMSGVYNAFKNKDMRQQVEEAVKKAAKAGDLVTMSALLDDEVSLLKDKKGFMRAKAEYKLLQKEYDEYNKRLADRKTYGVVNGRDAAVVVSWGLATVITLMTVLAFLNGYKIF